MIAIGAKKNAKSTSIKAKINGCCIMSRQQRLAALFKLLNFVLAKVGELSSSEGRSTIK